MNELHTPNPKDPANRDPLTDAPGAHPVGVGIGAAVGGAAAGIATAAATGAAFGTVAGPIGTVVGAAVGAIAGGLAGKAVAENYDPTVEDTYWREQHVNEPYYLRDKTYEDYSPAYRYAGESRGKHANRDYDEVEAEMANDWNRVRGTSSLTWEEARPAARAGWDRLDK